MIRSSHESHGSSIRNASRLLLYYEEQNIMCDLHLSKMFINARFTRPVTLTGFELTSKITITFILFSSNFYWLLLMERYEYIQVYFLLSPLLSKLFLKKNTSIFVYPSIWLVPVKNRYTKNVRKKPNVKIQKPEISNTTLTLSTHFIYSYIFNI